MAKAKRFDVILAEYRKKYDIDSLSSPNDSANLTALIQNQVAIETLQAELHTLIESGATANIRTIDQVSETINKIVERSLQLERALALDRKTRKTSEAASVIDYLTELKIMAREFVDQQLIKVTCPTCKILVGRIAPLVDHTAYKCEFECSQCHKMIRATRGVKDQFHDLPESDRRWRKQYEYTVIQAKETKTPTITASDELVIDDEVDTTTQTPDDEENEGLDNGAET